MEKISKYSFIDIVKMLNNKYIHFTSDCYLFPNFDVNVYIYNVELKNNEILFYCKEQKTNKKLTIGSNMSNLMFEIIS